MDSSGSRWGRMVDTCEHGYSIPGSIKVRWIFDHVNICLTSSERRSVELKHFSSKNARIQLFQFP